MKNFLHLKTAGLLILSALLVMFVISSCSKRGTGTATATAGGSSTGGDGDANDTKKRSKKTSKKVTYLECEEFDTGSGSDYCEEEDTDCKKWCAGRDYLNLSSRDARDTCYEMKKDTVEKLAEWVKDRGLIERPDYSDLDELNKEDIDLLCSAVKYLDYKILDRYFSDYKSKYGKVMLAWVAQNKEVLDIFENAVDSKGRDKGVPLMKDLLKAAGTNSGSDSDKIMSGLSVDLKRDENTDREDQQHVLSLANDANNEEFIDYIHDNIISDNDDGLCEAENDRPNPDAGAASKPYNVAEGNLADDSNYEACILGVYCRIAARSASAVTTDEEDAEFRKDMVEFVSDGGSVSDWINTVRAEGGLNGTPRGGGGTPAAIALDEEDGDEWTINACNNLKSFWNSSSSLDLDLE